MPREVKRESAAAAEVLEWSLGDWVLAAAAEHGRVLEERLGASGLGRRRRVEAPEFAALYLSTEERQELDELASACGLNRSAFVTAVAQLALGESLDEVVTQLRGRPNGG